MVLFMLSLISVSIGFFNVSTQYSRGTVSSETHQFHIDQPTSIITSSIKQQQTPLDYYFSAFSRNILEESKFALRSHAMFFYLILCFILPFGLYSFCSSFWITVVGTLLFSINHIIRLHSVSARPLCLALLTGFLFLFFYLSFIKNNKDTKLNINNLFPVLASQYLFAIAIGLQPVIFIISLFLSSFCLLLYKQKNLFKVLFITNIITGILTLPYYIKMFLFGKAAYKFKKFSFNQVTDYFNNFDIMSFIERYFYSFYEEMTALFLMLTLGLTIPILYKKRFSIQLLIILLALLFFPLIYDSIFNIGISWINLNTRYFIVFSLFLILFACLSLREIEKSLKINWRTYFYIGFSLVFIAGLIGQIQAIKNRTQFQHPYKDNSIEQIFHYLRQNASPEDIAIELALTPIVTPRISHIKAREFLFKNKKNPHFKDFYLEYTKQAPFFHEANGDFIYYIESWPIQALFKTINMFFIVKTYNWREDDAHNILSQFIEDKTVVGRYTIFKLPLTSPNKEKEYIQFLYKINKKTPKKFKGALLETLLYYAHKSKNKNEFDRLLSRYRDIEMALDEFSLRFNYPSRFELRRRVKYFENLKWQK